MGGREFYMKINKHHKCIGSLNVNENLQQKQNTDK